MTFEFISAAAAGLLPTLLFLAALVFFDSYKLISPRLIIAVLVVGGLAAVASYFANDLILASSNLSAKNFTRYIAPVVEEGIKASILIFLLRTNRIGFLVDAGIFGFAVGAGFAVVENLYYLQTAMDMPFSLWLVRGFGTAIMHGGVAAVFAVTTHALSDRKSAATVGDILPGLLLAILTHSLYNHFSVSPLISTFLVIVVLSVLAAFIFRLSESALENWLNVGFDADAELLEVINSGSLSDSHVGQYLETLKHHFKPEVVFDLICYLRLHVELALRAKGILMMRESGFNPDPDPDVRAYLEELSALETRVGPTGLLALKPFLHMSRKDLWQLYVLGK